jgi:hypothetical protein
MCALSSSDITTATRSYSDTVSSTRNQHNSTLSEICPRHNLLRVASVSIELHTPALHRPYLTARARGRSGFFARPDSLGTDAHQRSGDSRGNRSIERRACAGYHITVPLKGSPHQTTKIVRLGLLQKPIAFRKAIAIPLCIAKYGAFLQVEDRCNNVRFRNDASGHKCPVKLYL